MNEYTMWTGPDIVPLWHAVVPLILGCISGLIVVTAYKENSLPKLAMLFVAIIAFFLITISLIIGKQTYPEGTKKHFCLSQLDIDTPVYRKYKDTEYLYSHRQKKCTHKLEYIAIEGQWRVVTDERIHYKPFE